MYQPDCGESGAPLKVKNRGFERIYHLHSAMSNGIPTHALIEIVTNCHDELAGHSSPQCVIALANILKVKLQHNLW